jgi:hypothetical protein
MKSKFTSLQEFRLFPKLPLEIQQHIFRIATRIPRLINTLQTNKPPLLHVNRLSRSVVKDENAFIESSYSPGWREPERFLRSYLHPARDIIYRTASKDSACEFETESIFRIGFLMAEARTVYYETYL